MDAIALSEHLFEAAYVVDEDRKILYCNHVFEEITGYTKEEVIGKHCQDNILRHVTASGKQLCYDGCPLNESIEKRKVNTTKVYLHHKDGYRIPVHVKTIPYQDEKTGKQQAIEIFTDYMRDAVIYQENRRLKKSAMIDSLTQVFNRRFMDYQLDMCMREFNTFETPLALLFIDIDHFKDINDQYGHDMGDKVLTTIAKTLAFNIRKADFIGRYGGEEFIMLIRDVTEIEMHLIAEKLRALVEKTHVEIAKGKHISMTVSIGASYFKTGMTKQSFIKDADTLMYQAKSAGRNKVVTNPIKD